MAGTRRRVVDESDAVELLDAWEDSGIDLPTFCERRGVDGRSMRHWAGKLGRDQVDAAVSGVRLLELTVPPPAARSIYRVVVGEIVIEVDDTFRDDTLVRIIDLVSGC